MKLLILGDLHLIAPDDPDPPRRRRRHHFAAAWPSFKAMAHRVRREKPDLVIALGDLVDYYSPANRDFALELLAELDAPWVTTPGNHDLSYPAAKAAATGHCPNGGQAAEPDPNIAARRGWAEAGIDLGNRRIDAGDLQLLLMDTAASAVTADTLDWLAAATDPHAPQLLFTHVPVNHPEVVSHILSVDPGRDLNKYVQHPPIFDSHLRGRIEAVFTGHLHFPGLVHVDGTAMHMLPLSITAVDRPYRGQGAATVLQTRGRRWTLHCIRPEEP